MTVSDSRSWTPPVERAPARKIAVPTPTEADVLVVLGALMLVAGAVVLLLLVWLELG